MLFVTVSEMYHCAHACISLTQLTCNYEREPQDQIRKLDLSKKVLDLNNKEKKKNQLMYSLKKITSNK